MTTITIHEDCADDATKQFARDFNVAFAKGDMKYVLDCFSDDIRWRVISHPIVEGKAAVTEMIKQMDEVAEELIIENIISDGDRCVVNGSLKYAGSTVVFCDVYTLTKQAGAIKMNSITGYAIDPDKDAESAT